jgi:hypothetical protein
MHAGADVFNGGEIDSNFIAGVCVLDNSNNSGLFVYNQTVIQTNFGFGVFYDFKVVNFIHPVCFNQPWLEANGAEWTSGTIPGVDEGFSTVVIDTLNGPQTLVPKSIEILKDATMSGETVEIMFGGKDGKTGLGTVTPTTPFEVVGDVFVNGVDKGVYIGQIGNQASILYRSSGRLEITPRAGYNTAFMTGNIVPGSDMTQQLGAASYKFDAVYSKVYWAGSTALAGVSGSFTTADSKTVTVTGGIITSIV